MNAAFIESIKTSFRFARPDLPWALIEEKVNAAQQPFLHVRAEQVLKDWHSLAISGKKLPFEDGYPSPPSPVLTGEELSRLLASTQE